jgi:S-adenosyl methyltransferase
MPAPKKYPDEVRERAVRMVFEVREESGQQQGAIARVADRLGVNRETHITGDGTSQADADQVIAMMRKGMADPPTLRSHAEVRRFFDGFDLLPPGLVPVHHWRPEHDNPHLPQWRKPGDQDGPFWMYAGVGRIPG